MESFAVTPNDTQRTARAAPSSAHKLTISFSARSVVAWFAVVVFVASISGLPAGIPLSIAAVLTLRLLDRRDRESAAFARIWALAMVWSAMKLGTLAFSGVSVAGRRAGPLLFGGGIRSQLVAAVLFGLSVCALAQEQFLRHEPCGRQHRFGSCDVVTLMSGIALVMAFAAPLPSVFMTALVSSVGVFIVCAIAMHPALMVKTKGPLDLLSEDSWRVVVLATAIGIVGLL